MKSGRICVLGHVTRDIVRGPGDAERTQPGGTAYYAAAALACLGFPVHLVTRMARRDHVLLDGLKGLGVSVAARDSVETTAFETVYRENPDRPGREPLAVADPFDESDFEGVAARAVVMDPLATHDGFTALMSAAARAAPLVALDLQGWVRKFLIPGVSETTRAEQLAGLIHVSVLKADIEEAAKLTYETNPARAAAALAGLGAREVIVTMGGEGSHVLAEGRGYDIPAYPPQALVDPTGAGDSYLAGYVAARLEGMNPAEAGRFGAALASLKLARHGPFAGTWEDVLALLTGMTG